MSGNPAPAIDEALAGRAARYHTVVDSTYLYVNSMDSDQSNRNFPCTACGACCRNLRHTPLYASLDRGDGTCLHFDTGTNLCRIYESRPKICRVAEMFEAFEDRLTWEEYVDLNLQSCHELHAQTRALELATRPIERSDTCSSSI